MRYVEDNFNIQYDKEQYTLFFHGSLRLNDLGEFDNIKKLMHEAYELDSPQMTMDFTSLDFMNSAGISTLCKFIVEVMDHSPYKPLTIVGNGNILWQQKSFENLRKIWGKLSIEFEMENKA